MTLSFQRLFHVLPEERGKVLHFALLAGLLQTGVAIGTTAADSLFLAHLGAGRLPIVYLGMPVVMVCYAPVYSLLLERLGIDRLVQLTLAALVCGGTALGLANSLAGAQPPAWLLYVGKFYAGMWFIALYTLFWNFADACFSLRDGKRLYGIVAAGGSLGGIAGSGCVSALAHLIDPGRMYLAWAACALLTMPVFANLRRSHQPIESEHHDEAEAGGRQPVLRVVLATFRESRFALWVTVLCFAAVSLTALLEFLAMGVLSEGRTAGELAALLGRLQALAYVLTLVINLVLFSRVVGSLGVPTTAAILPLAYLAGFGLLYFQPGPVAAIVAFYAYQAVLPGIDYNNVNLLFNAVPARAKAILRTFVEAMAEPLATAFTGVVLLSLATRLGASHLAIAGVLAAAGALAIALLLRVEYVTALAENLRRDWLNFGDAKRDWSATLTPADRALLHRQARDGSRAQQRVAADLLWRTRDPAAPAILRRLLSTASPGEAPQLRPAIALLLQADDAESVAETRRWLSGPDAPTEPEIVDEFTAAGLIAPRRVQAWQQADAAQPGTAAPVPQWESAELEASEDTLAQIRDMLEGSPRERSWGLRSISDLGAPRYAEEILRFLADPDLSVRTEAFRTIAKLATPATPHLVELMLPRLGETTSEQRHLVFRLAARVGDDRALAALLRAADTFTAAEARALEAMLVELGPKALPPVLQVLRETSSPQAARSVAVRALSRIDLSQLVRLADELVDAGLIEAERHLDSCRALVSPGAETAGPVAVLARWYHDGALESIGFALEVLNRSGRLPDCDLIRASLLSGSARDRANALETLQQSCTRAVFDRILYVVEQSQPRTAGELEADPPRVEPVLRHAAESRSPLERAAGRCGLANRDQANLSADDGAVLPAETNRVAYVAALLRSACFADASIHALDYLADRASPRRTAPGDLVYDRGAAVEPFFYVVISGTVELSRPGRNRTAVAGDVVGERTLMLDERRTDQARSGGAELLVLPVAAVTRAIEIFPSLGVSLYRFKTVSSVL